MHNTANDRPDRQARIAGGITQSQPQDILGQLRAAQNTTPQTVEEALEMMITAALAAGHTIRRSS